MRSFLPVAICLLSVSLTLCSCLPPRHHIPPVHYYTLEYDPPEGQTNATVPAIIEVARFSIAPDYATLRMVFKDGPYRRSEYAYHRWHADPADLVTSFLRRDCNRSGVFLAVNDPGMVHAPTHSISGSVDAFYERDKAATWEAVLELTVTLSKADEPDVSRRILLQRSYTSVRTCQTRTPEGVAQAMSLAMQEISRRIRSDVAAAILAE
ncbi:ABC-type transport auxiliary lipoprotein family protein [Desulfoplanes formicivorans]|uniref:ABC-type transport auxiliary lipoprotein component domain-containing protein n=1 Tax=Desulfoplanes formicivorans TaxID=1592317 RepID=A0A194AJ88_9BACT|nr:ABC-type transport auxiliary lipoprotein family protein [Desulfoplanes formicivorans]GAU08814.1 hypothetical protein DPF_1531 [Desulfoplanes formicivorans]